MIQRLGVAPETLQDKPEMVVSLGELRVANQCTPQQAHSIVGEAALCLQQAEITKSTRVFRFDAQDVAVQNLCLIEFFLIMQGDRSV